MRRLVTRKAIHCRWKMPSVSVIVTVLNEAGEIGALLASFQQQTLPPGEIVIVDGGSTDGTWEQLVAAQQIMGTLRAIRDESCSLRHSAGPIARGRNIAIAASTGDILACADGGCRYAPDWLERLTSALWGGSADYALGGSRLDLATAAVWDIAAAPFLGVKLAADEPTKSCTARSMAFTRAAWQRAGGFPESLFIGEDVLFDQTMRSFARTAFAAGAKAIYTPRNTMRGTLRQVSSYAVADGIAGMRPVRLLRNVLRCLAELLAAGLLLITGGFPLTALPALLVLVLEIYFAYRLDWRQVRRLGPAVLAARLVLSLAVPWVVATGQIRGMLRKQYQVNRQNLS